jgi:virginiamycin B lyase
LINYFSWNANVYNQDFHWICNGLSTGTFSEQSFSLELTQTKEVSFIFTPASDLGAGEYTLMLGAQNDAITIMKAIKVHILG